MDTTRFPANGPKGSNARFVSYMGTLHSCSRCLIGMPASASMTSNMKLHPNRKATQSSCHLDSKSLISAIGFPFSKRLYLGTSVRRSPVGALFAGTGDLILPTLFMKGKGGIVGIANIVPHLCSSIYNYFLKGDLEKAKEVQMKVTYLNTNLMQKYNQVSSIKEGMNWLGQPAGYPRRPSLPLTCTEKQEIIPHLHIVSPE